MSKIREVLDHCNKVLPETTFTKINEMIRKEMPCLVNLAVNKDREVDSINAQEMITKKFATHGPKMIEELFRKHMQNTTLNLYPTTSTSTAGKLSADLQQQLIGIRHTKANTLRGAPFDRPREKEVCFITAQDTCNFLPRNDLKELKSRWVSKVIKKFKLEERKIEHLRNELLKSLIVFIRSSVIWDRVHDYQHGMESYQMKVNLTSPILGFPNIEAEKPYSITTLPFVGLIYENSKKQKRIMDIDKIPKLCDATLKRVLVKGKKDQYECEA
ncbi:hypothetical protein Tco_1578606 [Tanacetum coccineum]